MISGLFTAAREAVVCLPIRGPKGEEHEIEAVIDTGFNGSLILPPAFIAKLGLTWRQRGKAVLADGRTGLFDIFEAIVIWDGKLRRVAVDAIDADPLVGMSLIYGHDLTIEAVAGGRVTIQARRSNPPVTSSGDRR